ncbi:hypothetical protein NW768_008003 [Fusarium equiseti]|uniref:Uncharacterized protein n=1 Tax=Fusarium equiseti TaxID=61235 RepID=A0ABQ8R5V7_FUSEQ|nr:hypothetical protein NW768_008003 [Fusarium equiseti]
MSNPPAPPPLPPSINFRAPPPQVLPPLVPESGPPGSPLLHLVMYSGGTFNNYWNWYIPSSHDPSIGTIIHAPGNVHSGFRFEIKRHHDFRDEPSMPLHIIALQWIDGGYLDEAAMFNNGCRVDDDKPVCEFERSVHKVKPPGKSPNPVGSGAPKTKVVQRNCQTWIVESADQLVTDGILRSDVAIYLHDIKQNNLWLSDGIEDDGRLNDATEDD